MVKNLIDLFKTLMNDLLFFLHRFDQKQFHSIEKLILESEKKHDCEIRVVFERTLPLTYVFQSKPSYARALGLFAQLRVWDTEKNNGLLFYVCTSLKTVEILVDRAVFKVLDQSELDQMAKALSEGFGHSTFPKAFEQSLNLIQNKLELHFPNLASPNELANEVVKL